MLCHSVFSCFASPEPNFSVVASENDATFFPLGVVLNSGSFPRLPINITLFTDAIMFLSVKMNTGQVFL